MSEKNTIQLLNEIEEYKKLVARLNETISTYEKQAELSKESFHYSEEAAKRNYDSQKVINAILNLSLGNFSLDEILQNALLSILSIPWLKKKESGCIFLYDKQNQNLILKAQQNIGQQLKLECSISSTRQCLCVHAVKTREIQFKDNIDTCSVLLPDNRSHYSIPISTADQVLGVLNVYLEESHEKDNFEAEFLNSVSRYLAQIIMHRSAEETLKKLSRAVEQAADHIIITDNEGIIEYTNKAFESLTGYTCADWKGKTPRILKSGLHEKSIYDRVWETILNGRIHRGITINKKKNGELYYEEKTITPLIDANGTITHFVSTGRDITERIRAEAELLEAKELAEKSERLKSDFLAQMSHEIRTPVNSILNFASLLKYELQGSLPEELRSMFTYIDSGGRRLIRTIDLILNMSQIQTGNLIVDKTIIDLGGDVLGDVFMELRPLANEKKIKLTYETKIQFSKIFGDLYTLGQIFTNIIDNAIKFTDQGEVKVILYENHENIVVDVIDTGVGISGEFMLKLFQPFSQEETGYTRRFEGNGLGLALVKKYIEANDADIAVESKKNVGTKFTVRFKKQQL
ncbi:MAG: ATP-binding protein [Methanococcaceae archaeon]